MSRELFFLVMFPVLLALVSSVEALINLKYLRSKKAYSETSKVRTTLWRDKLGIILLKKLSIVQGKGHIGYWITDEGVRKMAKFEKIAAGVIVVAILLIVAIVYLNIASAFGN